MENVLVVGDSYLGSCCWDVDHGSDWGYFVRVFLRFIDVCRVFMRSRGEINSGDY